MIAAGLLAAVVVGPSLLVHGAILLARRWAEDRIELPTETAPRAQPPPPNPADVGILIAAHDRAGAIAAAVAAAGRVVPRANVHVVSNGSTDRTAEVAREQGVDVVETFGELDPAGAVVAGLQAFQLAQRFGYVLVLDADTRLTPGHLHHVLPLFDDPAVAAADARVTADPHAPGVLGQVLAAYSARTSVLTQAFGRGRRGPPASLTRAVPAAGRVYRSTALAGLRLDPPGVAEPDFDVTLQVYGRGLGRVALSPGPPAVVTTPDRIPTHRARTARLNVGLWQAVRRHRPRWDVTGVALAGQVLEAVVAAVVLALVVPATVLVALVPGPVGPLEPVLAVLAADYLLTVAAAVAARQPRYLLAGPVFPLLRVLDSVDLLWTAARSGFGRTTPAAHHRLPVRATLGWTLAVATAAVAAVRVALAATTMPASPAEVALTEAGYGRVAAGTGLPPLPDLLAVSGRQLDVYATLTAPFGRHAGVLTGARELSVAAVVVLLVAVVLATAALRVRPLVVVAVLAVLAAAGPAVTVLGPLVPGVLAAAWLAVAGLGAGWLHRAAATRGPTLMLLSALLALVAGALAVLTVPLLLVPAGVGLAGWLWFLEAERDEPDATWRGPAALMLLLTGCVVAVLWRFDLLLGPTGGSLPAGRREAVLAAAAVVAVAALVARRARPVGLGLAAGVGLTVGFGADADALLPALVAAAAVGAALSTDALLSYVDQLRPAVAPRRVTVALTAAVAAAAAVVGARVAPPVAPFADHHTLAGWVTTQLDGDLTLTVPAGVWADVHRDLARLDPRATVRHTGAGPPAELLVTAGRVDRRDGTVLGHYGTLTLLATDFDEDYRDPTERATAGARLAANDRLRTTGEVRAALRTGAVDLRAMAVVAGLCAEHDITLAATRNPPSERDSGLPHRTLVVSAVDGRRVADPAAAAPVLAWLDAQLPPYAPDSRLRTPDGLAITWRLPPLPTETTR